MNRASVRRNDRTRAVLIASLSGALLGALPVTAAPISVLASDSGFVTEAGGSAKGDGTVVSAAKYNYSVGFELHYASGALFAPLDPMLRKNYFVFDLSGVPAPIAAAKLRLWTGKLESADAGELYVIHDTTDPMLALGLAAALAAGVMAEFGTPGAGLIPAAKTLYGKLSDGPFVLASMGITAAMDDSFIEIDFTAAGVAYLDALRGGKVILGGMVASVTPPAFPQQPFGFTGPDIPGADPLTPELILTTVVPLPAALGLMLAGGLALLIGAPRGRTG
jgi:hypothetical protein